MQCHSPAYDRIIVSIEACPVSANTHVQLFAIWCGGRGHDRILNDCGPHNPWAPQLLTGSCKAVPLHLLY